MQKCLIYFSALVTLKFKVDSYLKADSHDVLLTRAGAAGSGAGAAGAAGACAAGAGAAGAGAADCCAAADGYGKFSIFSAARRVYEPYCHH